MTRTHTIIAQAAFVLLVALVQPLTAQVRGRIVRVGLFAGARPIVRGGDWSFAEVELSWTGNEAFDGELHVDQLDRDGDVATSFVPVSLVPTGEPRSYEVYFVPHDVGRNDTVRVKLFDGRGRLVKMLDEAGKEVSDLVSKPIYDLPADEFLIVDMTVPRKLAHVAWLDSGRVNKVGWVNARKVRGMSPEELPSRWEGLEVADAIVWDNADPAELSEQQVGALVNWVKAGGRLLITAGRDWQNLATSTLADALPVAVTGRHRVTEAQEFTEIVNNDDYERILDRHYSNHGISRCQMRPLSDAPPITIPIPADCANRQIAYRRLLGRGSVAFVGASLRELLPVPPRIAGEPEAAGDRGPVPPDAPDSPANDPFVQICEEVVGRKLLALAEVQREPTSLMMIDRQPSDLFRLVRHSVGFGSLSAAFLVFAVLFAIAYTLIATVGSYWYLNRRAWRHHCWTAFALVSIAGGIIGTAMVWLLRGVTTKVWQTTIVDGYDGDPYAYASCLFGVKTPDHTRLELRLPVGTPDEISGQRFGPLRAMPEASSLEAIDSRFVAPEDYRCDVPHWWLIDVPVRATLKEFQGAWHGSMGGTLDGKLVSKAVDHPVFEYEFAEGSYLRNSLGVDLRDCYILETKTPERLTLDASRVHCFYLGDLPKSSPGNVLDGKQIRQMLFYEEQRASADGPLSRRTSWPWLNDKIKTWIRTLPHSTFISGDGEPQVERLSADSEYYAVLLLSVFDLLDHEALGQRTVRCSHGRSLDCTHRLTSRTAVLIGWSDEPPPALLEIDRAKYKPSKSLTIYRFVIPVERPRIY
ncbi:MAG: ion transporter [Phycisphaerae bacterium]|nr:ion transporter [Phycisphaerae bacterium]